MWLRKAVLASAAALLFAAQANAAQVPIVSGPVDPSNWLATMNGWIIQNLNPSVPIPEGTPRNLLDNGAMAVNQRAATATAATTSGCAETSYSADRWCADVNIASGAGQLAVVTSSPTPPLGFQNVSTLVRNSGTPGLGQPQCALQELPTVKATQMQGQVVNFSVDMLALGNLAADNGNLANLYLITGTGTAQGLGALRSAVGMTTTTKGSSVTISATTGIITNATSVVAGQPVWFTAGTAPTGITLGAIYYVSSTNLNSGTSFSVASTYAGAIAGQVVIPSTAGSAVLIDVPYITPVWTGLAVYGAGNSGAGQSSAAQAFGQATAVPFTLSAASWGRFSTGPISVPATVTEAAVAVCFWPNAVVNGSSTDGIAFTGAQLELLGPNQVTPTAFEFRELSLEYLAAYRYAYAWPEAASGVDQLIGQTLSTTSCGFALTFPYPMDVAPTLSQIGTAITSGTTYKTNQAGTLYNVSAMATATANATTGASFTVTAATMTNASGGCQLQGLGGAAIPLWGADF